MSRQFVMPQDAEAARIYDEYCDIAAALMLAVDAGFAAQPRVLPFGWGTKLDMAMREWRQLHDLDYEDVMRAHYRLRRSVAAARVGASR